MRWNFLVRADPKCCCKSLLTSWAWLFCCLFKLKLCWFLWSPNNHFVLQRQSRAGLPVTPGAEQKYLGTAAEMGILGISGNSGDFWELQDVLRYFKYVKYSIKPVHTTKTFLIPFCILKYSFLMQFFFSQRLQWLCRAVISNQKFLFKFRNVGICWTSVFLSPCSDCCK